MPYSIGNGKIKFNPSNGKPHTSKGGDESAKGRLNGGGWQGKPLSALT
ncbi:MAG: hypothetical protein LUI05_09590 [Oscillospiraceae bacterium]|nr:hypothetical protein [Oscillospiraceae bacterium]